MEHMESLAACAITVGNFSLLCFLLDGIKREEEEGREDWPVWAAGIGAYGLYAVGGEFQPEIYVLLVLVLWAVLPMIWGLKENMKKKEKRA